MVQASNNKKGKKHSVEGRMPPTVRRARPPVTNRQPPKFSFNNSTTSGSSKRGIFLFLFIFITLGVVMFLSKPNARSKYQEVSSMFRGTAHEKASEKVTSVIDKLHKKSSIIESNDIQNEETDEEKIQKELEAETSFHSEDNDDVDDDEKEESEKDNEKEENVKNTENDAQVNDALTGKEDSQINSSNDEQNEEDEEEPKNTNSAKELDEEKSEEGEGERNLDETIIPNNDAPDSSLNEDKDLKVDEEQDEDDQNDPDAQSKVSKDFETETNEIGEEDPTKSSKESIVVDELPKEDSTHVADENAVGVTIEGDDEEDDEEEEEEETAPIVKRFPLLKREELESHGIGHFLYVYRVTAPAVAVRTRPSPIGGLSAIAKDKKLGLTKSSHRQGDIVVGYKLSKAYGLWLKLGPNTWIPVTKKETPTAAFHPVMKQIRKITVPSNFRKYWKMKLSDCTHFKSENLRSICEDKTAIKEGVLRILKVTKLVPLDVLEYQPYLHNKHGHIKKKQTIKISPIEEEVKTETQENADEEVNSEINEKNDDINDESVDTETANEEDA